MPGFPQPSIFTRSRMWAVSHSFVSGILVVVALGGGYWLYTKTHSTSTEVRYVLGTVQKSTIISTISGSGQVSISDQVDIKSKSSGEVRSVLVKEGQSVAAGQAIAYVDSTVAQKNVRDAQANLQSTKISLSKILQPADQLSTTQQINVLINASTSLQTAYRDGGNDISSAFLDMPDIMTGLQDVVTGTQTNKSAQWNVDFYKNAIQGYTPRAATYRDDSYNSFVQAKNEYNTSFQEFKATTLNSDDTETIQKFLLKANKAIQTMSDATKSIGGFVQFYEDTLKAQGVTPSPIADTELTNIAAYTTKLNTHLSSLLADINAISSAKQKIAESQQSLDKLQKGSDVLDIESAQLNVTKAQNSLEDAQTALNDYVIRAPFSGILAKLSIVKGVQASSGGTIGTVISGTQIADLSVNEVDAAKIKVGQKASLTFDAIGGLSIAGVVGSIDTLGTVSQGVVSYVVKVQFSTQDERIKSGMTANANIIIDTHLDVLVVSSGAIKTQNNSKYVQAFVSALTATDPTGVTSTTVPQQISVTIGINDDTNTEILSGLTEGQQIVTKTTGGTATKATQAAQSRGGFGGPGIRL